MENEEMSERFEPELGQAVFGQPCKNYKVPPIGDAALEFIRHELQRILWNLRQVSLDPFSNTGEEFNSRAFSVHAYSWDEEEEQPWNFRHHETGVEISWYKYCGRGMSANQEITPQLASDILKSCLSQLESIENGDEPIA